MFTLIRRIFLKLIASSGLIPASPRRADSGNALYVLAMAANCRCRPLAIGSGDAA